MGTVIDFIVAAAILVFIVAMFIPKRGGQTKKK